ncbi:asparagine synthase-related protein [Pseudomaricurvus sp. HS19]|uniref:asparagine synthetase B family protein n=1 Tax=Pseudomaricurvus sp. HS19 TaxID=2692626 RepID=UPI0019275CE7
MQITTPRIHGIFGWFSLSRTTGSHSEDIYRMQQAVPTSLPVVVEHGSGYAIATTGALTIEEGELIAAVIGNPHWSDKSLQELQREQGPLAALLQAYRAYAERLFEYLWGDFSFVLIDRSQHRILLATDRFCQHTLYHSQQDDVLVFGTTARSVAAHPANKSALNPQALYDYVYFHMVPSPHCIYQGVEKLAAAHLLVSDGSHSNSRRYWLPEFHETLHRGEELLQKDLKRYLREAVRQQLVGQKGRSVGSFLSGGLDSSTVTGFLAELTDSRAPAFSIGFSAEGYDEMEYARIAAQHFGVSLNEYYVTPQDVTDALPMIATSYDEPFGNSSALPAWFCAQLAAREGIDVLLAGDGGDELFAGNERYARQLVFERYARLPGACRDLLAPAVKSLPGGVPLFRKAGSYIEQASVPLPDRLQTYNYLHRHDPAEVFCEEFLSGIDTALPIQLQRDIYGQVSTFAEPVNAMMYLDWQLTLADNDLRKVSHMCAYSGLDVRYPMLEDRLVAFSCQVPSKVKLHKGNLRDFYKRSLRGWLPDATIDKKKQGFGLPFGVWLKEYAPLQELARHHLHNLQQRGIIRPEFIARLQMLHESTHAHYYGEMVWILIVLDIWLDSVD